MKGGLNKTGINAKTTNISYNTMGKNAVNNGYSHYGRLGFGGLTRQVGKTGMDTQKID